MHRYGAQPPALPAASPEQVPSAPAPVASAQAAHPPEQVLSQQTPSTQLPELHCVPVPHDCPVPSSAPVQVPPEQLPDAHSLFPPHGAPLALLGTQAPLAQ